MFFAVSLFLCQFFPTLVVTTWALMGAAYVPTFARTPSVNGRRMLKSIVGHWVVVELEKYFQLAIYKNFDALPSDSRFIIGYHPHGIFPAACLYMTRTRQWQRMFPHVLPAVLSSSIVHYVPLFRDVLQLLGGYEVSRGVFISALRKHDSVVLVPGGQVEMISSRSDSNSITIDTSHRGFVKLALEQAARSNKPIYLLPTYGFNETRTLDNVRAPHAMQRFVTKALKANVIYLPYGQFGLPGYPRTVPVSVAIGEPVKVPPVHHPTRTQVDLVYRRYLDSLQAAFEAFKRDAGCEDDSLVFSPPEQTLDAGSFEDAWAAVKDDSNPTPKKHHPRHNGVEMLIMGSLLSFLFWTIVWTAYHQRHN
ncbi:hypothetical protein PTSG_08358 [Salpingoeca rosetta]|uniref:Acyltransferase n=1 Tax=Salpingoeca rosetta (strain ATCC 50818 / BSB-021) TaxID=946362 RepID=F2UJG5_SALR5|nr:uncharacterized protein PTSG_08358 [Salpingoeca rosetta]EGD77264.1 hypothetical protein PTSG_08358 [Salpingoeca rosetta]|eukprot:XP_004990608.1 hypothetical protein PTSG_08358 [Salpingoeca rosetta]